MRMLAALRLRLSRGQLLSGLSPVVTAAVALGLCAAALLVGRPPRVAAAPPLSGVLYSAAADSGTATADGEGPVPSPMAPYPEIKLSIAPAARGKFPPGNEFLARIVPPGVSTFTVTLAQPDVLPAPRPRRLVRQEEPKRPAPPVADTPPRAPAPAVPTPTPTPPPPPPAPKAAQPATFVEFDEALRESPTTETINLRLKRAGVTFRATHVGRLGERAVVRFALANEESSDFFLSIVNVWADGTPIQSETAGPYACRAGQEVFGIVHFAAADAAGKRVTVELVQSGGERRHFALVLDYRF